MKSFTWFSSRCHLRAIYRLLHVQPHFAFHFHGKRFAPRRLAFGMPTLCYEQIDAPMSHECEFTIRHVDPIDTSYVERIDDDNDRCNDGMHVKGIQDTVTSFEVVVSIPAPTYKRQKITFTTPISVRCNGRGKSRNRSTYGELPHVCGDVCM
jgi:hypothetical protein